MSHNLIPIFYLISGILFILALRGLSSPETSRKGNFYGVVGMVIAIVTTLIVIKIPFSSVTTWSMLLAGIFIGGTIGTIIAQRIAMTAMPQLVAGFHSLVGLAAVLVAIAALYSPGSYGIASDTGLIKISSSIEMSIGVVIGAITFTGSIIAFLKLQGLMTGAPIVFKGQHYLNALIGLMILGGIVFFCITQEKNMFLLVMILSLLVGILIIILI